MAFSSSAMSASSHISMVPGKISRSSNPNLIEVTSLPTINKKGNITRDKTDVISIPLKHFTYPSRNPSFSDDIHVEHSLKLKAFRSIFGKVGEDSFEGLAMIDAVQRLGIDYHFRDEIEEILQRQYMISSTYGGHCNDLHEVALGFRLLRQDGHYVSADIFNNFRDEEGKFNQNVSEDINGLMSLYESSQLGIRGEDVLDEALDFSSKCLNECAKHLDNYQVLAIRNTLRHPYHKSLSRFTSEDVFLSNFQGENLGTLHVLKELAKTDFNMVQSLHQKEIVRVSKWWKDLGLAKKLEFARDQPLKWYIWSMACLTDPSLSEQRVELTKPISLIYIIDDIFDVYGTLDELTLFTETINRWDLSAMDTLPEYMKICFKALDDITNEISCKIYKELGYNPVQSLRKAWASLCNAFLVEAKWFASGHLPKAEEYLKNGIVSSGVHVVLVHIFFLLGQCVTRESVDIIDNNPEIISSTATILRLWDDLGSAKDENQDGKDGSYIHYYMKEHGEDSSSEGAKTNAINKISDAWKRLNKECLCPNPFSKTFTSASLNLARMVPLMYSYDDNQRLPSLEEYIKSLLFENVPIRGVY